MGITINFSEAAQKKMREALEHKIGPKIENLAFGLQEEMFDTTPANTGRTLASWKLTRNKPSTIDAGDSGDFTYMPGVDAPTNNLPIGSEPHRGFYETLAREGRTSLFISKKPYDKFYVSNAAKVGSLFDSSFSQNQPGLRAALMNSGAIPDYDYTTGQHGAFEHRGQGMFERAVASFLRNYKKYLKEKINV